MAFFSCKLPSAGTLSAYISSFAVIIGNVFCAIFVVFFDLVGILLGAMRGALIGRETGSGIVRGAEVGAISGAVIAIEVFASSVELWKADKFGIGCLLYLIDVIVSLLNGRLVQERFRPEVLSELQDLLGDGEPGVDVLSRIQLGGYKGLSVYSIDKIPTITITNVFDVNDSSERILCSVCLQDFQLGETVRSLLKCQHMFHLPCIDKWLVIHGSCPLCRRDQMQEHTDM